MLLRRPLTFGGTSGQTSRRRTDLGHAEKRGGWRLWREREGGRGAPIICTVKRELEVSPVRLSGERREGEIKVAEWRFLLREFGELVKRVILFDAATATATDSRISRYRPRPPRSVIHNRTKGVVSNGSSFLRQ